MPLSVRSRSAHQSAAATAATRSNDVLSLPRATFSCNTPLRAELVGSDRCTITGFASTSTTPVLALCRTLLAAGFDPDQPLEAYRGATLTLRIRSIGEAAALELNSEATGFRRRRQPDAAPPIAPIVSESAEIGAER
jgi:hypothetical protein